MASSSAMTLKNGPFKIQIKLINKILANVSKLLRTRLVKNDSTQNNGNQDSENISFLSFEYIQTHCIDSIVGKIEEKSIYVNTSRITASKNPIIREQGSLLSHIETFAKDTQLLANSKNTKSFENKFEFINYIITIFTRKFTQEKCFLKVGCYF